MIIFATLHNGTHYAFVSDLLWQLEGFTQREERPWLIRKFADHDAEGTRENLLHMVDHSRQYSIEMIAFRF